MPCLVRLSQDDIENKHVPPIDQIDQVVVQDERDPPLCATCHEPISKYYVNNQKVRINQEVVYEIVLASSQPKWGPSQEVVELVLWQITLSDTLQVAE